MHRSRCYFPLMSKLIMRSVSSHVDIMCYLHGGRNVYGRLQERRILEQVRKQL